MPEDLTSAPVVCPISILVLAPHPDDFDAMGVTLKYFHDKGSEIHLAVVSSGVGGVDDSACDPPTIANKIALRQAEQLASCDYFGLARQHVTFLPLVEDDTHHPMDSAENLAIIREFFVSIHPETVFLPHGNDKNATHRLTYRFFRQIAMSVDFPVTAYLSCDPKTQDMRFDRYLSFDEKQAEWKAALLGHHVSQQSRNMKTRGYGFDERILRVNREIAEKLAVQEPCAEVFEVEYFPPRDAR